MISGNGKFSGKILRQIFRTGKFSMENFPPHITNYNQTTSVESFCFLAGHIPSVLSRHLRIKR
jgi:hypothetical protein